MKTISKWMRYGALATGLLVLTQSAMADDRDSNADATFGSVSGSSGALVRVPVNANGDEDTNAAELRVFKGAAGAAVAPASLPTVWDDAVSMAPVTVAPANSSSDSSTNWWGWNNWGGRGWRSPYYYYYNYTPAFNYYGNYYSYYGYSYPYYSYPSYYNVYYPFNGYYGYRYYYYPRYYR